MGFAGSGFEREGDQGLRASRSMAFGKASFLTED
jgi:hypothetical protein